MTRLDKPGVVHLHNGSQVKFDTVKHVNIDVVPGIQILNKTSHTVTSFQVGSGVPSKASKMDDEEHEDIIYKAPDFLKFSANAQQVPRGEPLVVGVQAERHNSAKKQQRTEKLVQ